MTIVRLGYVAMSMGLKNASPSKAMTFTQFQKIEDRAAAMHKLERIALENLENTHRILKHNLFNDIYFYRFSSRLIPLATHEELSDWDYIRPLKGKLAEIGEFVKKHMMRVDFHPDHFVVLNSPRREVFLNSITNLEMHYLLLTAMNLDATHRCVLHVGGKYNDIEKSLERFVVNWNDIPLPIQQMIMLENDDTSFTLDDTLYLCEKLGIPLIFDYHHHLAYHRHDRWDDKWDRVVATWRGSPLPIKMHISSPKSEDKFRHHSDYVDVDMFFRFLNEIKGSTPQIDCMIEAKQKDEALFTLINKIKERKDIQMIDDSSFSI